MREPNQCDACGARTRVLSLDMAIRCNGRRVGIPSTHLCEECLVYAPDLARVALEVEGGAPTLVEQLSEAGARPRRTRALYVVVDAMSAVYCKWRGVNR